MLLRVMVRAEVHPAGEQVLIIFGSTTPIVPTSNWAQLAARLTAGANIRTRALPHGATGCRRRILSKVAIGRNFAKLAVPSSHH